MSNGMSDVRRKSQECVAKAGPALDRASRIAGALKLEGCEKELRTIRLNLGEDRFTVIIFGRFKSGKSTILNALLGKAEYLIPDLPEASGLMPVDVNPATAVSTRIYYSEKPKVHAISDSGKKKEWTFSDYIKHGKQKLFKEETKLFFADIRAFEVGFPTTFCKGGVELIDSPGTDDNPEMDLITFQAAKEADAAVLALSHPGTMGISEEEYLEDLIDSGVTSYLTVVNARDPDPPRVKAMPPIYDTKAVTWDRIVTNIRKKGKYAGQPLETEDIFFMNAYQAFKGRMAGDEKAVQESGIVEFEIRLAQYLESERRYVHLQRFLGAAEPMLNSIQQTISKQHSALETDLRTFQDRLAEQQPKLAEVSKRAKRIPGIINHHRLQAQAALQQSLEELYDEIERDLPIYMQGQQIPSLHNENILLRILELLKSQLTRKKLSKEAMDIAVAYVRSRVKKWQNAPLEEKGAPGALKSCVDKMIEELKAEAAAIEREYNQAQIALTGWTPPEAMASSRTASLPSRVTAVVFGALTGQFDYVFLGGLKGWGGVFRDLLARVAISAPLVFVFHLALPVALPFAIAGGVIWATLGGTDKLEADIKKAAVDVLLKGCPGDEKKKIPQFGGLFREPRRLREIIAAAVAAKFGEIEQRVMKEVNGQIQIEEQALLNQQEDVLENASERGKKLESLKSYEAEIQLCRAELKQAWTSAAQSGKDPITNPIALSA